MYALFSSPFTLRGRFTMAREVKPTLNDNASRLLEVATEMTTYYDVAQEWYPFWTALGLYDQLALQGTDRLGDSLLNVYTLADRKD